MKTSVKFILFVTALFLYGNIFLTFSPIPAAAAPPKVPGNRSASSVRRPPGMQPTPHLPPRTPQPQRPEPGRGPRPGTRYEPGHGPHEFHRPPGPPPHIPMALYPPTVVTVPYAVPYAVPYETGNVYPGSRDFYDSGAGYEAGYDAGYDASARSLGLFKAYVYTDTVPGAEIPPDGDENADAVKVKVEAEPGNALKQGAAAPAGVQQTGVAQFYLDGQNFVSGYFYTSTKIPPFPIQGSVDPQTGELKFRVVGTSGTYSTSLQALTAQDKVNLTFERENEETGVREVLDVGYLARVE